MAFSFYFLQKVEEFGCLLFQNSSLVEIAS